MARRKGAQEGDFDLAVVIEVKPSGKVLMRRHVRGAWQKARVEPRSAVAKPCFALTDQHRRALASIGVDGLPGEASRGR